MSKLVKDRSGTSSDAPSNSDTESRPPQSTISSGDQQSTNTDFVRLPPKIDMNSSFSSAAMAASMMDNTTSQPIRRHEVTSQQPDWSTTSQSRFAPMTESSNHAYSRPQSTNQHLYSAQQPSLHHQSQRMAPPLNYDQVTAAQPAGIMQPHLSDISDIDGAADSLSLKVHMLTNRPGTSTPTRDLSSGTYVPSGYRASIMPVRQKDTLVHREAGPTLSAIDSENAALRAELEMINSDRTHLYQVTVRESIFIIL